MKKEEIYEKVQDVMSTIEQLYHIDIKDKKRRIENIKRINLDSLIDLMVEESITSNKEITNYIETIIQD